MADPLQNEDWHNETEKLTSETVPIRPLRLLEGAVEAPAALSPDEEWIRARVAAGQTVVSYMVEHRQTDGRPTTFRPQYDQPH